MTRYGGMGRTRPKKLTSKASIPIVREDQIDFIDEDVQSALQQVETGVEKAEESVSAFLFPSPFGPCMYVSRDSRDTIQKKKFAMSCYATCHIIVC